MTATAILSVKPCIKCGSAERDTNGNCKPCQHSYSAAWKAKNKARIASSEEPAFYTYIHRKADDGEVFYVGKGKGDRARYEFGRSQYWQRIKKKHGVLIEIVARHESEEDAFTHEKFLIASFRGLGVRLCNMTDGGDGPSGHKHSDESKKRMSQASSGREVSKETRVKLSNALKGRTRSHEVKARISISNSGKKRTAEQIQRNSEFRKGKPLTPETIAKISAANTGKKRSAEARANISAGHMGKQISAEHRAKISAGNKGRIRSDEFKAKVSAGLTGRPCSEETRKKISEKHKGRVITQEQREKISKTLTGVKLSEATKAKLQAWADNPERKARHSAAMKGRPWSEARRAAVKGIPWSAARREAQNEKTQQIPLI